MNTQKILQIYILHPLPFPSHPLPRTPKLQACGGRGWSSVHMSLSPDASFPRSCWSVWYYLMAYFLSKRKEQREKRERLRVGFYLLLFDIIYDYFNFGPTSQESHCNGCNRYQYNSITCTYVYLSTSFFCIACTYVYLSISFFTSHIFS